MLRASLSGGRKLLLLVVLAIAGVGGAWWWGTPPREPVHEGLRLSEWLLRGRNTTGMSQLSARQFAAHLPPPEGSRVAELQAFGPDGIKWLAYWVEHGRGARDTVAYRSIRPQPHLLDRAPDWVRRRVSVKWGGLRAPQEIRRDLAADSLSLLGPAAAAAIPGLARTLKSEDDTAFYNVANALHSIGPASWPAVLRTLERGSKPARTSLVSTISVRAGSPSSPAPQAEVAQVYDVLVKACHDSEATVRYIAVSAIATCHQNRPDLPLPEAMLPELIRLLSDAEHSVRAPAAEVVGLFGAKAAPAVPRLIELLEDENSSVRERAARSLANVDMAEKRSLPHLRSMLQDTDPNCRLQASKTLAALSTSTGQ